MEAHTEYMEKLNSMRDKYDDKIRKLYSRITDKDKSINKLKQDMELMSPSRKRTLSNDSAVEKTKELEHQLQQAKH